MHEHSDGRDDTVGILHQSRALAEHDVRGIVEQRERRAMRPAEA